MKEKHVLVMALSTFPRANATGETKLRETRYIYKDASSEKTYECTGYYQLDPIPQFITNQLKETITDVILLATDETKKPRENVQPTPDGSSRVEWSAVEYFKENLKKYIDPNVNIEVKDIDENNPSKVLEVVLETIRGLYHQADGKENFKLWFDTHGGFRDISMVLVSAARLFAVDEGDPIDTDGIFSVYHSQTNNEDTIINQTAFYFCESTEALKRFLNYGQYLQVPFQPYDGEGKYAFISYSQDNALVTSVRNVFTKFCEMHLPFWYDAGIRYGENWYKKLKEKNENSSIFIALLSNAYFQSEICLKELICAIDTKKQKLNKLHWIRLEPNIIISEDNLLKITKKWRQEDGFAVTDEDFLQVIHTIKEQQNIRWFNYMDYEETLEKRTLMDETLTNDLQRIINSMEE